MTEAEYIELCLACDALLLEPEVPLERLAIAWLHVLNEHPVNLAQYAALFSDLGTKRLLFGWSALKQILVQLKKVGQEQAQVRPPPQCDVVFVSHLLNAAQVGARDDFYYGRLPELLGEERVSSCVVLLNATALPVRDLNNKWGADMAPRIVLPPRLSSRVEFRMRAQQWRERRRILAQRRSGTVLERRVRRSAASYASAPGSIAALRVYYQTYNLIKQLQPKAVVVTYEGHAWERLAFLAARHATPGIRCLGYHHTILFPRQHAALRLLGRGCDPDVILTAGDVSTERFCRALNGSQVKVATLGIHRSQPADDDRTHRVPFGARESTCLVMPDGIVSEVERLCDFAIAAAKNASNVRFLIRLHPIISLDGLKASFPRYRMLPTNVSFSSEPIATDFARSRWALYRGTNAAVYAVSAGLRPIYVAQPGELRIDSLNELKTWKKEALTPENLVSHIVADMQGTSSDAIEAAAAAAYCSRYFMPLDHSVLLDQIGAAGVS